MRRMFVAGNWKMNTDRASGAELARSVAKAVPHGYAVDVLVAPPFPYLLAVGEAIAGSGVLLGVRTPTSNPPERSQARRPSRCSRTSVVSTSFSVTANAGRSLRETDALINKKVTAAIEHGMGIILCVGETLEERDGGTTEQVLETQLSAGLNGVSADDCNGLVIAYEPVWAIGTGRNATPEQAQSAHAFIRGWLSNRFGSTVGAATRIQYGGSVKPDNAAQLLGQPDVDGALVGGASLKADSFLAIVRAAEQVAAARR